jgi:predicted  nucleic acid-binding Zn-ribbon protein
VVQEQLRALLDLQEVDEAIAEARHQQRKLPEQVAAELAAYTEAEEGLKEAARRDRETQLQDQEAHMQRLKGHLKDISNTREYQAYIQELDGVQRTIGKLEEEVLGILSDIDTTTEQVAGKRKEFEAHKQVYEAERAKVDVELARIEKDVEVDKARRTERAAKVEPALLKRYERVAAGVRRPVVPVRGGAACSGCHMNIPPQLVSEVKRGSRVHECPHCHRLLYVADPVEGAA